MSPVYQVNLMPLEPILFADNRSARAGEDHAIRDQDPSPHTIYGAIGAYLARRCNAAIDSAQWNPEVQALLGPFKPEIENDSTARAELMGYFYQDLQQRAWFPNPRHVVLKKNNARLTVGTILQPQEMSFAGSSLAAEGFSHFFAHEPEENETEDDHFISQELLQKILSGEDAHDAASNHFMSATEMYQPEIRLGLKMINVKNQVEEGLLFSRPYRRFVSGVDFSAKAWRAFSINAFYKTLAKLDSAIVSSNLVTFLGGDRRRAVIRFEEESVGPLHDIRDNVKAQVDNSRGFFIYLLTPAVREAVWPKIDDRSPLAAALGKEMTISGWNTNRQEQHPRPIRRLIPAGSTFFYEWKKGEDRSGTLDRLWMQPLSNQYRNSGFGRMLIGVWP